MQEPSPGHCGRASLETDCSWQREALVVFGAGVGQPADPAAVAVGPTAQASLLVSR